MNTSSPPLPSRRRLFARRLRGAGGRAASWASLAFFSVSSGGTLWVWRGERKAERKKSQGPFRARTLSPMPIMAQLSLSLCLSLFSSVCWKLVPLSLANQVVVTQPFRSLRSSPLGKYLHCSSRTLSWSWSPGGCLFLFLGDARREVSAPCKGNLDFSIYVSICGHARARVCVCCVYEHVFKYYMMIHRFFRRCKQSTPKKQTNPSPQYSYVIVQFGYLYDVSNHSSPPPCRSPTPAEGGRWWVGGKRKREKQPAGVRARACVCVGEDPKNVTDEDNRDLWAAHPRPARRKGQGRRRGRMVWPWRWVVGGVWVIPSSLHQPFAL